MTLREWTSTLASLLCVACAAPSPPRTATSARDTCSSVTPPGSSAATIKSLERASSSLEYENVWRAAHPSAATGTVNGEEVRATIRAHASEVQECYAAALLNSNESGGRVVVRFVIDPSGRVPTVTIGASELHAPELGCCVVKRVAEWTFPKPENAGFVVVEYPFVVHLAQSK
jgi:outer membrane biosynthesis protein TonB